MKALSDMSRPLEMRIGVRFRYWTLGTYREKNTQLLDWARRWGLPADVAAVPV